MVRDGSLSGLRTTYRRIAITAATVALAAAAPPVFAADPAFTAYPLITPNAGLSSIALGPDGAMWFTGSGVGVVGRIDAAGSITEFALDDPTSRPASIAAGADGNLWFTIESLDQIARLTPSGEFVPFQLFGDESSPAGITAGPDGALWFTERVGDRIGRIDPATSDISEFDLEVGSGPTEITVGPDGALWFTEPQIAALGWLDPATGAAGRVELPAGPNDVASADGALWATLPATNQIARVTPDGSITLLTTPTDTSAPRSIAADPANGVLWFTDRGTNQLVRLAFDGTMTEFEVDTDAGLTDVAVDRAGRPWVTQARRNSIGVLSLDAAPPDTTAPTITIPSPAAGAWTVSGTGALLADYACADEGGSGLATCDGTVSDGAALPDGSLGVASLDVHATDVAGNTADASAPYLVFSSASGSVLEPAPARAGEGLTLELGMGLPPKAIPLAAATTTPVSCGTGEAIASAEPADVRTRVTHLGELSMRWVTSRSWTGCWTLTLRFAGASWEGADAVFGPVAFASAKR